MPRRVAPKVAGEEISSVNFCRRRVVKCGKKYRSYATRRLQRRRRVRRSGRRRRCGGAVVAAAAAAAAAARTIPPLAPLHFRFTSPFRKSLSVPPSIPSSHQSPIFIDGCIRHRRQGGPRANDDADADGPDHLPGRRKGKKEAKDALPTTEILAVSPHPLCAAF